MSKIKATLGATGLFVLGGVVAYGMTVSPIVSVVLIGGCLIGAWYCLYKILRVL